MYKYINEDTNGYMGNKRCYVPDELEKINNIIDGIDSENECINEENEDVDNAQFEIINRTIHNQKAINNSTNYRIMTIYLSKLKKTYNGKKIVFKERNDIVESLLENDTHFTDLTEKLFETRSSDKDYLIPRLIEFPLECMGSYIQCTQNSNAYLRRKYFDGQIRKRKDGSTYQRKYNISTESDLVKIGEDGEEFSPYQNVKTYDKYFDGIDDLLSVLNDNEREVAICLNYLSTYNKRATIKEIVKYTNFTKRQVETLIINIRIKMLKYLSDNGMCDTYKRYYELCKHNKEFNKNMQIAQNKCEKIASLCSILIRGYCLLVRLYIFMLWKTPKQGVSPFNKVPNNHQFKVLFGTFFMTYIVVTLKHIISLERRGILKERVKKYLDESGIPKTIFCRRLGISTYHLYAWLKGDRNISDELRNRVKEYLDRYSVL